VGGGADLLRELVDLGHDVGNLAQRGVQFLAQSEAFVDDARAAVHVLDRLAGLFLNALNQFRDFLGGLRGFLSQLAHFVGNHGESKAMLARSRSFDGRIQSQQVRLFGQIVDHLDDLANIVGALAENIDDFPGGANGGVDTVEAVSSLVHGPDSAVNLFARAVRNIEQHLGSIGDPLDRGDHLIDRCRSLADTGSLGLRALHHILHVDAHLVHGAGYFVDGGGSLEADFGGLVGGSGNLGRGAGYL